MRRKLLWTASWLGGVPLLQQPLAVVIAREPFSAEARVTSRTRVGQEAGSNTAPNALLFCAPMTRMARPQANAASSRLIENELRANYTTGPHERAVV